METTNFNLQHPYRQHLSLFLLAAFCISLLIVRAALTHSLFFFFLIWNLFLAFTPFAITTLMMQKIHLIDNRRYFYPLALCWLVLLPNAPYIITDFVHLQRELAVPVWFDVLLLISFTASGLLFGLASMQHMYTIVRSHRGRYVTKLIMMAVCLLSAYGIYLGRYLRYNSWDLLHRPLSLITDILSSFTDPAYYKASIGITLGFGTLLYLLFSLYKDHDENSLNKSN